jgi:kynurenine formamidase
MPVVDLTHAFDNGMPVFPGLPEPAFASVSTVEADGFALTRYAMVNHIGTHIDAPSHRIADGDSLDEIGLERIVTDAVTIDVSARDPHGEVSLDEIEPQLDRVRPGDLVLFVSDNARNYGREAYWTGYSYPGVDAAEALIACGVSGVGFDGPSADPVASTTFVMHDVWLGAGRVILENLDGLATLPGRFPIVVAPFKVARGNGAPARVFALLP